MDWFRMYGDMPNDPKIGTLSDAEFRTWVELLCMACKAEKDGATGLTEATINWALRRNATETLQKLIATNLVAINEDGEIVISAWEKRQYASDSSTDRVRKHRERLKNQELNEGNQDETLQKRFGNGLDTEQNRTDTDTDNTSATAEGAGTDVPRSDLPNCPHQQIIALYHELLPMGLQVRTWNGERPKNLQARWREDAKRQNLEWWRRFFTYAAKSEFLTGRAQSARDRDPFVVSLDWLVAPKNFAKVIDGRYHREAA